MDEFSLIQQFFAEANNAPSDNSVILGIGDDAAVIRPGTGEQLLFTTDTLINAVHFPDNTPPQAVGHKSLAVNLSDIAAMAGTARWFTLALSLPSADPVWLQSFSKGLLELANEFDVQLVGGDTTRGSLSITISVIGTVAENRAISRTTANVGDKVFITGEPGLASMGLLASKNEIDLPEKERKLCIDQLNYPQPRLKEGGFLRDYASSMIDVSDGLIADLMHITEASACSAVLFTQSLARLIPQSLEAGGRMTTESILYGGDDYELLFTVPADKCEKMTRDWPLTCSTISCIGEITAGEGIFLQGDTGDRRILTVAGYNHFHD